MKKEKMNWKKISVAVMSLTFAMGMAGISAITANQYGNVAIIASAEESTVGKCTVNIQLMQFHSDELSMGNESMIKSQ